MKKLSVYLLAALLSTIVFAIDSYAQSFYDINVIQKIELTFEQSNWDYMLDTAKAGSDGYGILRNNEIIFTKMLIMS